MVVLHIQIHVYVTYVIQTEQIEIQKQKGGALFFFFSYEQEGFFLLVHLAAGQTG